MQSLSMLETVITENMTEMQSSRARIRVKPNMEMISDSVTITDTMGDEVLAIDADGVRWSSKPKVYTCLKFLCLTPVTMWTVPEDNIPEAGSAPDILTQFIKFVFVTMEECFWCCPLLLVSLPRRFVNHKQSFITC